MYGNSFLIPNLSHTQLPIQDSCQLIAFFMIESPLSTFIVGKLMWTFYQKSQWNGQPYFIIKRI